MKRIIKSDYRTQQKLTFFSLAATTTTTDRTFRSELKTSQEMKSDTVIDGSGWKPLSEKHVELVKELVNKCLKGHIPGPRPAVCLRRIDIGKDTQSCLTTGSTDLFIDKIRLF